MAARIGDLMADGNILGKCLLNDDWPPSNTQRGAQIVRTLGQAPSHVRHDMLMDDQHIGRLIVKGGEVYKNMRAITGCNIWCLDTCEPPGFPSEMRLVVLVGLPVQVAGAVTMIVEIVKKTMRFQGELPMEPGDPKPIATYVG